MKKMQMPRFMGVKTFVRFYVKIFLLLIKWLKATRLVRNLYTWISLLKKIIIGYDFIFNKKFA